LGCRGGQDGGPFDGFRYSWSPIGETNKGALQENRRSNAKRMVGRPGGSAPRIARSFPKREGLKLVKGKKTCLRCRGVNPPSAGGGPWRSTIKNQSAMQKQRRKTASAVASRHKGHERSSKPVAQEGGFGMGGSEGKSEGLVCFCDPSRSASSLKEGGPKVPVPNRKKIVGEKKMKQVHSSKDSGQIWKTRSEKEKFSEKRDSKKGSQVHIRLR